MLATMLKYGADPLQTIINHQGQPEVAIELARRHIEPIRETLIPALRKSFTEQNYKWQQVIDMLEAALAGNPIPHLDAADTGSKKDFGRA